MERDNGTINETCCSSSKTHVYRVFIVVALLATMIANHQGNAYAIKAIQSSVYDRSFENVSLVEQDSIDPRKPRNLAALTALGTPSAIATVHHTVMSHLAHNDDWACMLFLYVNETDISANESRILDISQHCSIVRLPGLKWAHYLLSLTPAVVQHFDHVAIILDDVFAPNEGPSPIVMSTLLERMQHYNLSSISPSIKGAFWSSSHPTYDLLHACLKQVNVLETFFQIFTRQHWMCYHSYLHHSNPQAFCMDLCSQKLCPGTFAVDESMIAYHLGRQYWVDRFVPNVSLGSAKLDFGMRRDYPKGVIDHWDVCDKHNCSKDKAYASWSTPITCGIWSNTSQLLER